MNVKKSTTIMGPLCAYCIFENGLMESKNKKGCTYYTFRMTVLFLKPLGDVNFNTLDVGIAQCSFSSL